MLASPAPAQDAAPDVSGCDSYPNVPVSVTPLFEEPQADFTQNLATIQQIARDPRHSLAESLALGVTRYNPVLEIHVPIEVVTPPSGLACAYVKHADVTVGYRDVVVFIASEIPRDSCGFAEIMGHEQKHIAVNRELLAKYAPLIEEKLRSYLKLYGVFRVENVDYAKSLLHDRLGAITGDLVAQMQSENVELQRQVDSPEEYARLGRVCNGELAAIAGEFRQTGR
jgi:hypothetical protein